MICLREGKTLVMVHVDHHDPAYQWAKRNKVIRVGKVIRMVPVVAEESASEELGYVEKGPLADIRDRIFAKFDLGPGAAEAFRHVPSDDSLLELVELLPTYLGEALYYLANDPDDLNQILLAFEREKKAHEAGKQKSTSLSVAVNAPINASAVWVPPPGEKALASALSGELEDWRVFLHPSQKRIVTAHTKGALKVTGGPGTGKTVVALHRARHLATRVFQSDERPILLTTFSRTLAHQLETMVLQLCEGQPELVERLEVQTLVETSRKLLRSAGRPDALLLGDTVEACWEEALQHETLGFKRQFYEAERTHVVGRNGAWTGTAYLRTVRRGRPHRFDRTKRRAVWRVIEAFDAALAKRGGGDGLALAREATKVVADKTVAVPWAAVVCDELQDAGAGELRLLAALTRDDGTGKCRPDALFLCGDGYQRLYRAPLPLTQCAIDIRGRSRKLRLNYRTTEGIRRAAVEVVRGIPLDEIDEVEAEEMTALEGYRSVRSGPMPERRDFATVGEEADWIAERAGEGALLVLCRTVRYRDELADLLTHRGVTPFVLDGLGDAAADGVTLCTLHRSKGLEAPRVIIAGRQGIPARWPGEGVMDKKRWERQERCLLYVGMTRARDWCGVSGVSP
ncbi:MAG: AAA family ATPase [Proteobacteria bacterium]|nr:AAA family ATPase [Pseudomonadota bacterium]